VCGREDARDAEPLLGLSADAGCALAGLDKLEAWPAVLDRKLEEAVLNPPPDPDLDGASGILLG
jgi:hypothetical protein